MPTYTVRIIETVSHEVVVEADDEQKARVLGFETITYDKHNQTIKTTSSGDATISVSKHYG